MKITVDTKQFVNKVNLLKRVIPSRTPLPALKGILVRSDMTMVGNNMRSGMSVKLVAEQSTEGDTPPSYIIPSRIVDICGKLKSDGTLSLDFANDSVTIKVDGSKFKLKTMPGEDFPDFPDVPDTDKHYIAGNELVGLLRSTVHSVAVEQLHAFLCGVFLKGTNGVLTAMATDRKRFAVATMPYDGEFEGIVIPTEFVKVMIGTITNEDVWLTVANNQLVCGQGDVVLTSLLIAETFPEEQPNKAVEITKAYEHSTTCSMSEFNHAVDMALLLSNPETSNRVIINSSDGALSVAASSDVGGALNLINAEVDGVLQNACLNGLFVKGILSTLSGENLILKYAGATHPILIHSDGDDSVLGILMTMVIKEE